MAGRPRPAGGRRSACALAAQRAAGTVGRTVHAAELGSGKGNHALGGYDFDLLREPGVGRSSFTTAKFGWNLAVSAQARAHRLSSSATTRTRTRLAGLGIPTPDSGLGGALAGGRSDLAAEWIGRWGRPWANQDGVSEATGSSVLAEPVVRTVASSFGTTSVPTHAAEPSGYLRGVAVLSDYVVQQR